MTENKNTRPSSNLLQYLSNVAFPADKRALLQHVNNLNAEGSIVQMIEQLPEQQYQSIEDVVTRVGNQA